jgi:thymidine kinase
LDMWGDPFETIEALKACAEIVRVQRAVCACCNEPATHTHRKTPIVDRNLVGGEDDFEPRCETCWAPPPEPHIDSADMA